MNILIRRLTMTTPPSIPGKLEVGGLFNCPTLENDEVKIPVGSYPISLSFSNHLQRILPELEVPDRTGIRIHAGNESCDSKGCILIGTIIGPNDTLSYPSRPAEDALVEVLRSNPTITTCAIV